MSEVAVEGETIKLGPFLKLSGLIDSGGEAKRAIGAGLVRVNGEVETRRGRALELGDEVSVAENSAVVAPS